MKSWGMKVPSPYPKACTSKPSFLAKVGAVHSENQARRNLKMTAYSCKSCVPIVPLRFETSAGQAMLQTMRTTPHLLPVAIDQQLVQLQSNRVAHKKEILEEIIYCFVVNKLVENDIAMIPSVNIDSWPSYQEQKLKAFHSTDALDMIESHLTFLAERLVGHVSKQKLRKLYAANIKYGYYHKGVDVRFQLDRSMNMLPAIDDDDDDLHSDPFWDTESTILHDDCEEGDNVTYGLRTYVRHMDEETLRRYATIRSKEAVSLIEKQEQALFGRHDASSSDEVVGNRITSCLVKMLAMEAVAFGCFLWEAECYIQSKRGCLSS